MILDRNRAADRLRRGNARRELAELHFAGPIEIFMHPVPRGVPILDSIEAITAEVNHARAYLERTIG